MVCWLRGIVLAFVPLVLSSLGSAEEPNTSTPQAVSQTPLQKVLAGLQEASEAQIVDIYSLDVFHYFKSMEDYDTELKRAMFKKTPEYAEKLSELKSIRQKMLESHYFIVLPKLEIGDYDVQRKGFDLELGSNTGYGTAAARAPKEFARILFPSLPTRRVPWSVPGLMELPGVYGDHLFLAMNEQQGLKVESERQNCRLYLIFKVSGLQSVSYDYVSIGDQIHYHMKDRLLAANTTRAVFANEQTGEIYFDREFKAAAGAGTKKQKN